MISSARIFGAPESVPAGNAAANASTASRPRLRTPLTSLVMCITWLKRSVSMSRSTFTDPMRETRPTSLRPRSTSIVCSARSFGSARSSCSRRRSSSCVAPRRRAQGMREAPQRESLQDSSRQRLGALLRVLPDGQRPGAALPVVERDQLPDQQQLRFGKERIRAEPLREPLAPARASPTEIADITAGKRRQAFDALGALRFQRATEGLQRLRLLPQREPRLPGPHPDIAVAAERSLEEEGVSLLVLIEEAEDAERRQQITGKFDGRGRSASKAGSGKGSAWTGRLERMPTRCKHMIEAPAWRRPRGASRPRC